MKQSVHSLLLNGARAHARDLKQSPATISSLRVESHVHRCLAEDVSCHNTECRRVPDRGAAWIHGIIVIRHKAIEQHVALQRVQPFMQIRVQYTAQGGVAWEPPRDTSLTDELLDSDLNQRTVHSLAFLCQHRKLLR